MSDNEDFLEKRAAEITAKRDKITEETEIKLSLKVVNEMLHNQERLTTTVAALNDEIKRIQKKGGQTTLE